MSTDDLFALLAIGIICLVSLLLIGLHSAANIRAVKSTRGATVKKPSVTILLEAKNVSEVAAILESAYGQHIAGASYSLRLIIFVRTKRLTNYAKRYAKRLDAGRLTKSLTVVQLKRGGKLPVANVQKGLKGSITILAGTTLPTPKQIRLAVRALAAAQTTIVSGSVITKPGQSITSAMRSIGLLLETHLGWNAVIREPSPIIAVRTTALRRMFRQSTEQLSVDQLSQKVTGYMPSTYLPNLQSTQVATYYKPSALLFFGHIAYLLAAIIVLRYLGPSANILIFILIASVPFVVGALSISAASALHVSDKAKLLITLPLYWLFGPFWLIQLLFITSEIPSDGHSGVLKVKHKH